MTAFGAVGEYSASPEMHSFSGVIPLHAVFGLKRRTILIEDIPARPLAQHQQSRGKHCRERRDLLAFTSRLANLKNKYIKRS